MGNEDMEWTEGDIDGVTVRNAEIHTDERGWLAEIFRTDEIDSTIAPVMSYLSVTKPGTSRGPHAHNDQTDMFAFMGPGNFELRLWDNRKDSSSYGNTQSLKAGEDNPLIITVPPGIVHGYKNISDEDAWVINCPNRLFAGKGKAEPVDEIRYEEDPSSPFVLQDSHYRFLTQSSHFDTFKTN